MPWTLHEGDCLDADGLAALADHSVDHVITDPPYEAEAHTGQRRTKDAKNGHAQKIEADGAHGTRSRLAGVHALSFKPITEEERQQAAVEFVRVSRRWILVFCQVEAVAAWRAALVTAGARYRRACLWIKPDAQPQLTGDGPGQGYESIVAAQQPGRAKWNGGGKVGIYYFNKNSSEQGAPRLHPTQKPLGLMEQLVRDFTDQGETILDPYAGSATTGVACIRNGRNFIGWEREPAFADAARRRLDATRQQPELPFGKWRKPKQSGLAL